jgi:hypothetical protein
MIDQNETSAVGVENSTVVESADNGRAEVESSESEKNAQLLACFNSWHTGWIVTALPPDLLPEWSLPAFFHNVAWEGFNKNLMLTVIPEMTDPKSSPLRVLITGVTGIHFCPSTLRPPERLICFETEKGETLIIRLQLHLGRRSTYQRFHEPHVNQAVPPDL